MAEPTSRFGVDLSDPTVGVVFGNVSTTEFRFAVRDPSLKRLDYVQVEHPTDGVLVAHVVEMTRETNVTFEDASRASLRDTATRDHLVARARVIGFRDARGILQAPRTPLPAGSTVRRVDEGLLAHVFGLRDTEGAYIGVVKGYDLRVFLDINTLVQKHVSVLAKTGSGKSYAVGVLMEELIKQGVPIVVIDPHGEHASLAQPNTTASDQAARRRFGVTPRNYGEHIVEYSPDTVASPDAVPFRLESKNLEAREIADLLGGKPTNSQMGMLHAAVKELIDKEADYALEDVLEQVRESASNAKWNLVSTLESLVGLEVFSGPGTTIESLVQPKKVSILNLKGVSPDLQEMVVATTARRLFEARKLGKVPPFMLVVEEAHNFAPEKGLAGTPTGLVLRTVASEGRKFGMGLTVVSQRPAKVDKNVLSQCNTQIMLKVTNPNDLKALASSAEGFTSESEDEIQRLPVGVAFVSHPRISIPVLVEIRPRETSHGGESVDVMASVRESETPAPSGRGRGRDAQDDEQDEDADEERTLDIDVVPARATKASERPVSRPPALKQSQLPPTESVRVPETAAPTRVAAAPPRPPGWAESTFEAERVVARADLRKLDLPQLNRLHDDLAMKARALAGAHGDEALDALGQRLDAHLARVQDHIEKLERKEGSFASRLKRRLTARSTAPAGLDAEEPEISPRREAPRTSDLSASRAPAKASAKTPAKKPPKESPKRSAKKAAGKPAKKKAPKAAAKKPAKKAASKGAKKK